MSKFLAGLLLATLLVLTVDSVPRLKWVIVEPVTAPKLSPAETLEVDEVTQ